MNTLLLFSAVVSSGALVVWTWLVVGRGQFWRTDQRLGEDTLPVDGGTEWPAVSVVIPARNEGDLLPQTLATIFRQVYAGPLSIFPVDDRSEDATPEVARQTAVDCGSGGRLHVVEGSPLPKGWTGKVWALHQGIMSSRETESKYILLTDADIAHPSDSVRGLVLKAESQQLDLVSLMVRLGVETPWERLLIPAFVYFFAKLYPFRWANDHRNSTAAAGGCVLLRREALERAGGLERIADELIDDCALAGRIKRHGRPEGGRIWLGLARDVHSLRQYNSLSPIWTTVARTAYAQLRFSPLLLFGTVVGMVFLYLIPPLGALGGLAAVALSEEGAGIWLWATGLGAWAVMAGSYLPILRWHNTSPLFAPLLPLTAMLYTAMTVDSGVRWWRGKGGAWKGRTYDLEGRARY